MGLARDSVGPFVYVADFDAPSLDPADHHHLCRVRRLRSGDPIVVSDGQGWWAPSLLREGALALGAAEHVPPATDPVEVGIALVKGQKPELVVQKLTEIGVDRILLYAAERSVVRWDGDKVSKAIARLCAVARSAGAQSRRPRLPMIDWVELNVAFDGQGRLNVGVAAPGGHPSIAGVNRLLIGPEGGWGSEEIPTRIDRFDLGPTLLRSETAAIVAATLLCASRTPPTPT